MVRQGCSLSMLYKTCEKLKGHVRLGGLSMPNILCMLFYFKSRVLRRTLSHIWNKLNLPRFLFSVGLLILLYIEFFNSSGNVMVLPPYYLEVILSGGVACVITMVMYRGGSPKILEVSPCTAHHM